MFKLMGMEAVFPGAMGPLLEMGFKYSDLVDVVGASDALTLMPREWLRKAAFLEHYAGEAAEHGDKHLACETYHRAALSYARARWGLQEGTAEMADTYRRLTSCYNLAAGLLPDSSGRTTRVSIPVEGAVAIPGILHLPPAAAADPEPRPAVVIYPGMDMAKEYYPNLLANPFTKRGLAALTIDPPGHGESLGARNLLTRSNVERAGSAAIDFLRDMREIDADRIGVMGISFGSYFALSLAAEDARVRAVVAYQGGVFYDKRKFIAAMPPTFGSRLRAMSALEDPDQFDRLAAEMTLEGREANITCPSLIMTGEWDELDSLPQSEQLHSRVAGPSALVVYEGEGRLLGGVAPESTARALRWLVTVLAGGQPETGRCWVDSWKRTSLGPR